MQKRVCVWALWQQKHAQRSVISDKDGKSPSVRKLSWIAVEGGETMIYNENSLEIFGICLTIKIHSSHCLRSHNETEMITPICGKDQERFSSVKMYLCC